MQAKKPALRMCIGCGEMKPKRELVRIVKNKEGVISLDTVGRAPGRGAYICHDPACLQKAQKSRRLEKAFSSAIPAEIYEKITGELMQNE